VESIEATCYAMVSHSPLAELSPPLESSLGRQSGSSADARFNLVNHNNHGVDVSKYEK
jgi:hypothetical protein